MANNLKISREQLRAICRDDFQALKQFELLFAAVASSTSGGGGAVVADGDYLDVTVSDNGTVWTINPSGVTAGSYTNANVTVGADGRITSVSSGTDAGITELTGDVTAGPGSGSQAATIAANAVTNTKLADMAAETVKGRSNAGTGDPQDLTLGVSLTMSGTQLRRNTLTGAISCSSNSNTTTLNANVVANSNLATMAANRIKGTVSAGNPVDLTGTQATTILDVFTSALKGLAPASGGGTSNFLRADGTWAAPPDTGITQLTGDVTAGPGSGSQAATIANNAVTNAKLADVSTSTLKGRVTAGTGDPEDLTGTQATTLLDTFTSSLKGVAPASGGGTLNYLRADGSWAQPTQEDHVTSDSLLSSGAVDLTATLVVGTYKIHLVLMIDVVGGSGGDGAIVNNNNATLVLAASNYSIVAIGSTTGTTLQFPLSNASAAFAFVSDTSNRIEITGIVDVTTGGTLDFEIAEQGSPTSATLLAGSFLTVTRIG